MTCHHGRSAVLIIAYKNAMDVYSCLAALSKATSDPAFDVFICENGGEFAYEALNLALSGPNSPCRRGLGEARPPFDIQSSEVMPQVQGFHLLGRQTAVWLFRAAHNLGYAGAVNALIDRLKLAPDWSGVWILNPDTIPHPRALAELVERASVGDKGMVGSTLVAEGDERRIRCRGGHRWNPLMGRATTLGFNDHLENAVDVDSIEAELDCVSGASMFVTRACLERIGPMDERFFLYYEDFDWGIRARHLGLGYAAASVVTHKGGTTIGSSSVRRGKRSWLAIYLENRNRLHFTRKHYPSWLPFTVILAFFHALRYLLAGSWTDFKVALEGSAKGLNGEIGPPTGPSAKGLAPAWPKLTRPARWRTKLAISAVFWVLLALISLVRGALGLPRKGRFTILYYHGVQSDFRVEFSRQMEVLARSTNVVSVDFRGNLATNRSNVAISFDDAFVSVLRTAIPELSARSLPFTIFVPVGALGAVPSWEVENPGSTFGELVMTRAQLAVLPRALATLGSHSMSHPFLSTLSPRDLRAELEGSRAQLRAVTGLPVRLIAPPYGDLDSRVLAACAEAGYDFVYSTVPENVDASAPKMLRGRVRVDPWDGPIEFFLKFNGAYAWLPLFSGALKFVRKSHPTKKTISDPKDAEIASPSA